MPHTRKTLHLDPNIWDITLDGAGRIALCKGDAATAQNVANEVRLFTRDAYFLQDQGIPHFLVELGQRASRPVLRAYLRRAALRVADVKELLLVAAASFSPATRSLGGEIRFYSAAGEGGVITTCF